MSSNRLAPKYSFKSKNCLMHYIICGGANLNKDTTEEDILNVESTLDGVRSFDKSTIGGTPLSAYLWNFKVVL